MINKKNKFLTFVFSTMFGAGQMYMGFMKQGISIMMTTAIIISIGSWLSIGTIYFALPVLWFYSFFDSINKMTLADETFYSLEDHYIFISNNDTGMIKKLMVKHENIIAILLIVLGVSVLIENILNYLTSVLSRSGFPNLLSFVYMLRRDGSRILFAIAIILIGFRMIIGKKKELDMDETMLHQTSINDDTITATKEVVITEEIKKEIVNQDEVNEEIINQEIANTEIANTEITNKEEKKDENA